MAPYPHRYRDRVFHTWSQRHPTQCAILFCTWPLDTAARLCFSDLFHVLIFYTRTTCPTNLVLHLITQRKRLQYLAGNVPRKCQQHCTHVPLLHWVPVQSANIPRNALTCANVNWIMLSKRRHRERGNGRRERSHVNTKVYSNVWYIL